MWPFRRKPPMPPVSPVPMRIVGRYFIKEYDYNNECDVYVLIEKQSITPRVEVQKRFLGGPVGPSWCENGEPMILPSRAGGGDLAWAKRTAKRFGIKVADDAGKSL